MSYENITSSLENGIKIITISRPKNLNALNRDTIQELHSELSSCKEDDGVYVVVITGEGEKAFVAGADIKEFSDYSVEQGMKLSKDGHDKLFNFIENMNKPVIAAVNGFALGGGLELALSCHMRVASHNAKLGLPEVTLGLIPGYGGTQRLAQIAGKGKAFEMITTAQMISAEEALGVGLVNYVTTQSELIDKCKELANKVAANSGTAIEAAIKAINAGYDVSKDGYEEEIKEFGNAFGTKDFVEGTTAFMEKRKPEFRKKE